MFNRKSWPWTKLTTIACLLCLSPCVMAAPPPGFSTHALPPTFSGPNPGYYGPYMPGHYQYGNVNPSVYSNSAYPTLPSYGMSNTVPVQNGASLYGSSPTGTAPSGNLPATPNFGYDVPNGAPPIANLEPGRNTRVVIEVHLPTPDAQVWAEGQRTTNTGTWRWFISPPLVPGEHYLYNFRASWYENGQQIIQNRQVRVRAGQGIVVDFTKPAKKGPAASAATPS